MTIVKALAKKYKKEKTYKKSKNLGDERYSGHDTDNNKKALIDVLKYRKNTLKKKLSFPEETALVNSIAEKKPVTGLGNINSVMTSGTAICHKISDKTLRDNINTLLNDKNELLNFLKKHVNYIKPKDELHQTPSEGDYQNEAIEKYLEALNNLEELKSSKNPSKIRILAHSIGKNIANSPVNLFIGDSRQNSKNGKKFDPNQYRLSNTAPNVIPTTPRSVDARKVYKQFSGFKGEEGSSSAIPSLKK